MFLTFIYRHLQYETTKQKTDASKPYIYEPANLGAYIYSHDMKHPYSFYKSYMVKY